MGTRNSANKWSIFRTVGFICIALIAVASAAVGVVVFNFRHDNAILLALDDQAIEVTWNLMGKVSAATVYPSDPLFDDQQLKVLTDLSGLERLTLHGTAITDDGISHILKLPRLRWLDVSRTSVSDAGLVKLYGVQNPLEVLAIRSNVTSDGASTASSKTAKRLEVEI